MSEAYIYSYIVRYVVCGIPFVSNEHNLEMAKKEFIMLANDIFTDKAELIEIKKTEKTLSIYENRTNVKNSDVEDNTKQTETKQLHMVL